MGNFDELDIFADTSLRNDPFPYYEYLRAKGPAARLPRPGVVAITGYDEGLAVLRDSERYSSVNCATGPVLPLPFEPEEDDITAQIEKHRGEMTYAGLIVTQDPPVHGKTRALLMGLITPKRLKENEEFMWRLADRQLDELIDRGAFEAFADYGQPYATLVIADLLGVPESDHSKFRSLGLGAQMPGEIGGQADAHNPLAMIGAYFYNYVEERRREPRQDALTNLALAKYDDGSIPPIIDVVAVSTFLFGAGQHTTALLLASALRFLADDPELQNRLRSERELIPDFIEEVLRLEGPVQGDFRLSKVPTRIGDLDLAPGTTVTIMLNAMNRDPRRFENPNEFRMGRKNVHAHLAFGRGIHACVGAPLARAETRVSLERLFDRTSDIRINEAKHGPKGARRYEYEPSFILRGLKELHLEFTPKS